MNSRLIGFLGLAVIAVFAVSTGTVQSATPMSADEAASIVGGVANCRLAVKGDCDNDCNQACSDGLYIQCCVATSDQSDGCLMNTSNLPCKKEGQAVCSSCLGGEREGGWAAATSCS